MEITRITENNIEAFQDLFPEDFVFREEKAYQDRIQAKLTRARQYKKDQGKPYANRSGIINDL